MRFFYPQRHTRRVPYIQHPEPVLTNWERLLGAVLQKLHAPWWHRYRDRAVRQLFRHHYQWDGRCPYCYKWLYQNRQAKRVRHSQTHTHYLCHCGGVSHWNLKVAPTPFLEPNK